MAKAVAAAASFLTATAWGGYATPFSPDPEVGDAGSVRASVVSNTFQTDPPQTRPVMRHPWVARLETSVASRLAVEATLSDGIGMGVKAALVKESDGPLDLSLGFDELLHSADRSIFGVSPDSGQIATTGRAWIGAAQTWEFVRSRMALSVEPTSDSWNLVPWLGFETDFHLPFSLGWEARFEHEILRQSVGASLEWRPFRIAGGLSEFQSWILRDWSLGWHSTPRKGSRDGIDNPGWWVAVLFDIPQFAKPSSSAGEVRSVPVQAPAPVLDPQALQSVADLVQQRLLRAEIAELAVRAKSDTGTDPLAMAILRKRILSGGKSTREALWRIGLDPETALDERVQAVVTLSDGAALADTGSLETLSKDPAPRLRLESALALGRIAAGPAHRILETLAQDPETSVREAAKVFLKPKTP